MILVGDVGNTNITFGVMEGSKLLLTFRMTTKIERTSDEFGCFICEALRLNHQDVNKIEAVILASVVPQTMYSLTSGIRKYLHIHPMTVGMGTKTGIRIVYGNPREYGADRIVDAVAGLNIYGGPVIVIDYGTATTYDLIDQDGSFLAAVTSPGIKISANALWTGTAKLPEIEIAKPSTIMTCETVESMQAGVVFGQIGQTEYIINKIKKESGLLDAKVVATGGLGKLIAEETDMIDIYDADLTLQGLRIIYEKSKK